MKETKVNKEISKKTEAKYKAVNPEKFAASFTSDAPCYDELSNGKSVVLNLKNKHVENWLHNKIIVKEN